MTESMFDNIINTVQECVFWKDSDRRFIGVNQAFLDYYGFASADVLIGKTDEDMEWHSDPEPFRRDELRVLEGHSTYKVQGKCIIKDEERDIIASKRPIYEGDKIVGLVGSFVDITDVLRMKEASHNNQILYTSKDLRQYPFFDKLLDEFPIENILDPLTGIINRAHMYGFAESLISSETPFTFVILDLDNFKYINDTYGHHAGDLALTRLTRGLTEYMRGAGVVGRFGGDEMLLINLRDINDQDKTDYMEGMYHEEGPLRNKISVDDRELFITGTAGCASYPEDAKSYDELFALADRMLYLGKSKGRNCYNIYDRVKHKDLDINKLIKQGVYSNMNSLMAQLENVSGFENRLRSVRSILCDELNISNLYYVGSKRRLHALIDVSLDGDAGDIDRIMKEELFTAGSLDELAETSPVLYKTLQELDAGAVMIVRIGLNTETDGYLICTSSDDWHIWHEDECGILYFVAKSLAAYIRLSGEQIPD